MLKQDMIVLLGNNGTAFRGMALIFDIVSKPPCQSSQHVKYFFHFFSLRQVESMGNHLGLVGQVLNARMEYDRLRTLL